jgi:hypothetical protein
VSAKALTLLVVLAATRVRADEPIVTRPLALAGKDGQLTVSGAFPELFDDALLAELANGFAQTVFVRVYVYPEGADQAVWLAAATYRALYAQWDELYLVRLRDPRGERNLVEASRDSAAADLGTLKELPVCPLALLQPGRGYFLGVVLELNPVAPDLLAEVHRWLARPRGGAAGTDSLFGSFVSIFANPKLPEADRTLRFRSQRFVVGEGPP